MPEPLHTIGFLRRGYSPTGGVEAYLKGLATGLIGAGHSPFLFGTSQWPADQWPGGRILRCRGENLTVYTEDVMGHRKDPSNRIDLLLSVEKVPGCDIYRTDEGIHAEWLEARSRHIGPFSRIYQWISPKHREKLRLERLVFSPQGPRHVISLSERISRGIATRYGYPRDQITLIRNGVSAYPVVSRKDKKEARTALGLCPDVRTVLFVGTGWERKGLRFAIRAVESLRDPTVVLLVAGSGREHRYSSPSVRFLGPVKSMQEVYAASEVLLFPTLHDPFPLAAMEALSAGLPLITTTANGVSEIMTPGVHGDVVDDPSDIPALSRSLRTWLDFLKDPDHQATIRKGCASLAGQYSLERNLRETLDLILKLKPRG
jgi:UDP-glucose:(heptosyl)LPS alpha-1,3-glucosyltransferase